MKITNTENGIPYDKIRPMSIWKNTGPEQPVLNLKLPEGASINFAAFELAMAHLTVRYDLPEHKALGIIRQVVDASFKPGGPALGGTYAIVGTVEIEQ